MILVSIDADNMIYVMFNEDIINNKSGALHLEHIYTITSFDYDLDNLRIRNLSVNYAFKKFSANKYDRKIP